MKTVLFACPQMEALAERIVAAFPNRIERGRIRWDVFDDAYPNLFIEEVERDVEEREVAFLASLERPGNLLSQFAIMHALARYDPERLTVVTPYFPGTKDRADIEGEVVTAMTFARLLSGIPSGERKTRIVIFDIHSLQERDFFSDDVLVHLRSAIPILKEAIQDFGDTLAIVFPDEGAEKRFGKMFNGLPRIVCLKKRVGVRREFTIKEGDPQGKHCLIIDDLVMSGGTTQDCTTMLLERGAIGVTRFVTHGVLPKEAWRRFVNDPQGTFLMTDSCPMTVEAVKDIQAFRVLSLAPMIGRILVGKRKEN